MGSRLGEMPFAAITPCLTLGIGMSSFVGSYSFAALAVSALALIGAAILALRQVRRSLSLVLSLSTVVLCGLMLSLARRDRFSDLDLRSLLSRGLFPLDDLVLFEGCVAEEGNKLGAEIVSTIELRGFHKGDRWIRCAGRGLVRMPASADESTQAAPLKYGNRVRGWATWHVPRNFQNPGSADRVGLLQRRGIFLAGRVKSARLLEVIPQECGTFWKIGATAVRERLRSSLQILKQHGKQQQAAILASILVGDYSELDNKTREAFQNSGAYHTLVVSGLHVGWIAWALAHFSHLFKIPEALGRPLVAVGIVFYASVVGFQASISRCLWMFALYLVGQSLFRRAAPGNIVLASAFFLLVMRPDWLWDIGSQLSFLSVIAICLMALPTIERSLKPRLEPLRYLGNSDRLFPQSGKAHRSGRRLRFQLELMVEACADRWCPALGRSLAVAFRGAGRMAITLGGMVLVSLSVQLWLEPLLALHFNRISWIAPMANLVVVPVSSLVLAGGIAMALSADIPVLGSLLLEAASWLASVLLLSAQWIARVPGAWQRCPTPDLLWVLAGVLALFTWFVLKLRQSWIPCLLVAFHLACLAYGSLPLGSSARRLPGLERSNIGVSRDPSRVLRLMFLDVGEGDSLLVEFPDRRFWVLDAGGIRQVDSREENASLFDVGEAVVSRCLWALWTTKLERAIISHSDHDHAGGMQAVIRNFRIGRLNYGQTVPDSILIPIQALARAKGIPQSPVRAGDQFSIGEVLVRVVNPPGDGVPRSTNEDSVVLHVEFGRFSALLTGDLEKSAEAILLDRSPMIQSRLLKVAHHGSRYSTLDPFLDRIQPRWAIISAGRNNPFGHPSPEVIFRLLRHGVRPIVTIDQGAISFETDGMRYRIKTHIGGLLEEGDLPERPSPPHPQGQ